MIVQKRPDRTEFGSVILSTYEGSLYITFPNQHYFLVSGLAEGLILLAKLHYVFNIEYPKAASRMFIFLEHLLRVGEHRSGKLSKSMAALLRVG